MYNQNVYNTALGIASLAKAKGFTLKPKMGSPLEYAFRELSLDEQAIVTSQSYDAALNKADNIACTVIPSDGGLHIHKLFAWLETNYFSVLKEQIAFTRNYVLPMVRETAQEVDLTNANKRAQTEVNIYTMPRLALMDTPFGHQFENVSSVHQSVAPSMHPAFNEGNLNPAVVNAYLAREDNTMYAEAVQNMCEQYASAGVVADPKWTGDLLQDACTLLISSNHEILDNVVEPLSACRVLVAYWIAEQIKSEPFVGVGLNSTDLNVWCGGFMRGVAMTVAGNYQTLLNSMHASGQLVYRVIKSKRVVLVHGELMDEYISGFENAMGYDVVLGLLNVPKPEEFYLITAIKANQEELVRNARTFSLQDRKRIETTRLACVFDAVKNLLIRLVDEVKANPEHDLAAFFSPNKIAYDYIVEAGKVFDAESKSFDAALAPERLIARVLCRVLFAGTMAEEIISEIEIAFDGNMEAAEQDKEAMATLAITAVVNRWLLNQLEVVREIKTV